MNQEQRERCLNVLRTYTGPAATVMELCGSHTMALTQHGLRSLLPETLRLVSGPGCPVCVTPAGYLDAALQLAEHGVTLVTFGDLMRVPGAHSTLQTARAAGADIRVALSPLQAVRLAQAEPSREIVFLAVGFETTLPVMALAVQDAVRNEIRNFSLLPGLKRMPPALDVLLTDTEQHISAFLYPGHVCAVAGTTYYERLQQRGVSGVVAGFNAEELLLALTLILGELSRRKEPFFYNAYAQVVRPEGNRQAQELIDCFFASEDAVWRGLGLIKQSGLALREPWHDYDARRRFQLDIKELPELPGCRCGEVLRGRLLPPQCPLFGQDCTPETPVGPCMVSGEGSCAAHWRC